MLWLALVLLVLVAAALVRRAQRAPTTTRLTATAVPHRPEEMFAVPPDTLPIAWSAWSPTTFERAQRHGLPVVALLDAAWCESCVLYAATLAVSPDVRMALERDVVAVRVDIDRRPDVHARYHVTFDTIPTLIFLTARGDVWDLTGPQRPSELREAIRELSTSTERSIDPELELLRTARVEPVSASVASPGELTQAQADSVVAEILAALVQAWPHPEEVLDFDTPILEWDALGFLRRHAERTRSAVSRGLFLQGLRQLLAAPLLVDGSILQEMEAGDGRVSRARFLDTNANLLDHFRAAAEWSRDAIYTEAAQRAETYLLDTLYDENARLFRGAQGTLVVDESGWPLLRGSEHARMGNHSHAAGRKPHVVSFFPTPGNARAFIALPTHAAIPSALARLWDHFEREGRIPHDFRLDPEGRIVASEQEFLVDGVELGRATLAIRSERRKDIWLSRCVALAETLLVRYRSSDTALLCDRPQTALSHAPARMREPLTRVAQNARAAQFLFELALQTGDERDRRAALDIVRACVYALGSTSVWESSEVGSALLSGWPEQ
jgi:hypothetical protein